MATDIEGAEWVCPVCKRRNWNLMDECGGCHCPRNLNVIIQAKEEQKAASAAKKKGKKAAPAKAGKAKKKKK